MKSRKSALYIMRSRLAKKLAHSGAAKLPRIRYVTADAFHEARLYCLLSIEQTAKLLRVSDRTVHNWESGRCRIPYAAYKLMRILRGHELAGAAWKDFRLIGDTLWTPEGHALKSHQLAWWSLTCRMADSFRAMRAERRATVGMTAKPSPDLSSTPACSTGLVLSTTSDPETDQSQQIRGVWMTGPRPVVAPVIAGVMA